MPAGRFGRVFGGALPALTQGGESSIVFLVNLYHRYVCRSAQWRAAVCGHVPWVLDGIDLVKDVLEVGPGPGLTMDILSRRVERLTCVEINADSARARSLD